MGSHDEASADARSRKMQDLETVSLQCWSVADTTQIAVWGSYKDREGVHSEPLASGTLTYQLLRMPSVEQLIYCLGDELRLHWKEFCKLI